MTRSTDKQASECHVLDFFYDDENGCALTVFVNGIRFHIIADADRLKATSAKSKGIEEEYIKLISAVRDDTEQGDDPDNFRRRKELDVAELHNPENVTHDSQDSGHGSSEDGEDTKQDQDNDSAVDVTEESRGEKEVGVRESRVVLGQCHAPKSEKSIQNWMLSPFGPVFDDLAPASQVSKHQTLQEWYYGPVYFFNLTIEDDDLSAMKEESSKELEERIQNLIPRMPIPKYIKDLKIPMIQAKNIVVVENGVAPEPYHPTRVRVNDEIQFLKMVDMTQYQPTKREVKLLGQVEKKELYKQIRVPRLLGLVYEHSRSEMMGFLQTYIEEPTPLTEMLDSDVIEDNREKWASETKRIIDILHQNDIVWGDAKADNFMVDKHGELWIIDFGGSYTEGWVDPELMETQEGDNMGTEKIVNALEDPEANTYEPAIEQDQNKQQRFNDSDKVSKKRSRVDDGEEEDATSKRCR